MTCFVVEPLRPGLLLCRLSTGSSSISTCATVAGHLLVYFANAIRTGTVRLSRRSGPKHLIARLKVPVQLPEGHGQGLPPKPRPHHRQSLRN